MEDKLQVQILELVSQNIPQREIARRLSISKSCVWRRLHCYQGLSKWSDLTEAQQQLLLGCLLGDSSITIKRYKDKNDNTSFVYQFGHGYKQLKYLEFKRRLLSCSNSIRHRWRSFRDGPKTLYYAFSYQHKPYLTWLYNIAYQNGEKTVTTDWLNKLGPIGLAMWYQDDGNCRMIGRRRKSDGQCTQPSVRLATNGFQEIQIDIIIKYLFDKWGLVFHKLPPHRGIQICARCNHAIRFIEIVRDYLYLPKILPILNGAIGKALPILLRESDDAIPAHPLCRRSRILGNEALTTRQMLS